MSEAIGVAIALALFIAYLAVWVLAFVAIGYVSWQILFGGLLG